jgi:hypothetical protein
MLSSTRVCLDADELRQMIEVPIARMQRRSCCTTSAASHMSFVGRTVARAQEIEN